MDEAPNADEKHGLDFEHSWELLETPNKRAPLFHQLNGVAVIDLVDSLSNSDLPIHRQLVLLMLLLVVKDRGSAIYFDPCESSGADGSTEPGLEVSYVVDGILYDDIVPPPGMFWPMMVQEFEAITGLTSILHCLASRLRLLASKIDGQPRPYREGRFLLRAGDETIEVELIAEPSAHSERIHLILSPVSANLSDRAWEELNRVVKVREADKQEGSLELCSTGAVKRR